MSEDYPNDDDGDVLRRLSAGGSDMTTQREIDFHVDAPDQKRAAACLRAHEETGFPARMYLDEETGRWTVQHSRDMLARHGDILPIQADFERIAAPLGCASDGWGTFGNAPDEDDEE